MRRCSPVAPDARREHPLRAADGHFWFIGRADDVFKSSDYRVSPFEIESLLLECKPVAEAAVVPTPDPIRGFVPKAFVTELPKTVSGKIRRVQLRAQEASRTGASPRGFREEHARG